MPCLRNVGSNARTSRHATPSEDRRDRQIRSPSHPTSLSRNGDTDTAMPSCVSSPLTPAPPSPRSASASVYASASPALPNRSSSSSSTSNNAPSSKSHARKREKGYIKRPSNAFILFRTSFVSNGLIPSSIESHSQNLSRIAGQVWRSLPPAEKAPWMEKAREAKREHERMFPEYAYHPSDSYSLRGRRRVVKGRGEREVREVRERCRALAEWVKSGKEGGEGVGGEVGGDEMEVDGDVEKPAPVEKEKEKEKSRRTERKKAKAKSKPTVTEATNESVPTEGEKLNEPVIFPSRELDKPIVHCVNEFDRPQPLLDRRTLEDMGWPVPSGISFSTIRSGERLRGEERDAVMSASAMREDTPSSVSVSVSASAAAETRGSSNPPLLFNLPNTFIPPDYEDISTWPFTPTSSTSISTPTGSSNQPAASDERRPVTLPPIEQLTSTSTPTPNVNRDMNIPAESSSCTPTPVPVPILPTKVVRATREAFPGALRVPDRPRASVVAGHGASSSKTGGADGINMDAEADADTNRIASKGAYENVLPSKVRTYGASSSKATDADSINTDADADAETNRKVYENVLPSKIRTYGASSSKAIDADSISMGADGDAETNRTASKRVYEDVLPSKIRTYARASSPALQVPPSAAVRPPPGCSHLRDVPTPPNLMIPNEHEHEPGSRPNDPNDPMNEAEPKWRLRQVDRFPSRLRSCTSTGGVGTGTGVGGGVAKRRRVRFGGHRRCDETDVESEDSVSVGSSGVGAASGPASGSE